MNVDKLALHGGKPVRNKMIPYGRQYIDDNDIQAVTDVLKSPYLTTGPNIEMFEQKLCELTDTSFAVAISNGTSALHAACYAADIGEGDEVIVAPITGLIGLLTALLRLSASPVGRGLSRIYLEIIRNTPLLVQIFCFYFIMAPILDIGRMTTAVLALSLFEGAYASEIFRAGILPIHRGQWEACHSLGLPRWQGYRHVILPQAIRRIMPPLTSQAISLIKDSSLVSTIAVYELTMQGRAIIADTYLSFEIWAVVACIYLVLTVSLSILANTLKRRVHGAT